MGEATARKQRIPAALDRVESSWPGMQINWQGDSGAADGRPDRFLLRWETLGPNRDQPRPEPLPPPTMLKVIDVED